MKLNRLLRPLLLLIAALPLTTLAQNPIVQTWCTADPAPFVWDDTFYIYTGHDEDNADFFWMQEWRVYSSKDMVNWTDHGSPLALEDFPWADDRAWASQICERNGKFYWYICAQKNDTNGMAIGVAVGDSPLGPFHDGAGKPLAEGNWDYIDPTVFIDDDGRAFLYWGNPYCYYAELNEDMVSFKTEVRKFEQDEKSFGSIGYHERPKDMPVKDCYTEGPWVTKRGKKYYMIYAAGGVPEHISYSMGKSPLGPWKYMGVIMPNGGSKSFTNHCGVADFRGHSYFVYHTGDLSGQGFGRSVAIEEFKYNADGTFPTIHATREGVKPIATFSPFGRVEAETMAYSQGVKTEPNDKTGVFVTEIHLGDWTKLQAVEFSRQPKRFSARVASALRGGTLEMRLDSLQGEKICEVKVPHTGGWEEWQTLTTSNISPVTGTHDVYFKFTGRKGCKLFNFDYWEME